MTLKNKSVLIFIADLYDDMELHYPRIRLKEAGAKVVVAGEKEKESYKSKHGFPWTPDTSIDKIKEKDFDGLIIPGGYAPDKLRRIPKVLELTKQFFDAGKLIAFICHAGWIPASAKILKGMKCTSFFCIKDDLINAGAKWVDEPVVVDKNLISSRTPDDLPQFCPAIIDFLSKSKKSK